MQNKNQITGIYNPAKLGDFGFVDVEGEDKGYYVHSFNKKDALHGDKVLADIKIFRGKKEAVIKRVLERSDKIFIGSFQEGKKNSNGKGLSFGFVVVRDENFKTDVFVPGKYIGKAKTGDLVGIQIVSWENKKSPKGKIVEVLGDDSKKDLFVDSYILESGFKRKFPYELNKELNNISEKIDIKKELKSGRKDLRNLFTFTIDGEDAKDLDDAISIEKIPPLNLPLAGETSKYSPPAREGLGEGYKLYVHIADVSDYIKEDSNLDKIAIKRATSVYLTDRVIPMLPEKLSNNLCSLNPDTPKLTLTCEMLFSPQGICKKAKVYESIIESNFRLTYKEVDEIERSKINIGDSLFGGQKLTKDLILKIKESLELKKVIEKNKNMSGVLDFDFPETKIILEQTPPPSGTPLEKGRNAFSVKEIKEYPKYNSNKLIELFMVSTNENIGKLFSDLPFLHRIHPKPSLEDISKLQNTLNLFGVDFVLKKFDTKEFSKLLELIEKHKAKQVLEKVILRTLSKAIYSAENEGHFGLGLDFYSHFTSPIRRYPDLQIHRIIKEKINGKLDKKRINHYKNILDNIGDVCSTQERKAEKLEYKVRDYYICKFYENRVGEEFEGVISGLIPKGFFVELSDTSEGFVSIPPLNPLLSKEGKMNKVSRGGFLYNEDLMQFEDRKNKKNYVLGDKVKVILKEVDLSELRLNFEILQEKNLT